MLCYVLTVLFTSFRCNAPSIYCNGPEHYICHGIEGGKILRNGQLIIIRGNKMYNAQGIEL